MYVCYASHQYGDFIFRYPHIEEQEDKEEHPHALCFCLPLILRKLYNRRYHITHHDQVKDMFRLLLILLIIIVLVNILNGTWSVSDSYVNIYIIFFTILLLICIGTYIVARKFHIELNCIREGHLFHHHHHEDGTVREVDRPKPFEWDQV